MIIPQGGKVDELPESKPPVLDFGSDTAKGANDTFNAMSTPGFLGTDPSWINNSKTDSTVHGPKSVRNTYSGEINGWNPNNPKFTASETTDSFGRIQNRNVTYEGEGLNFEVDKGNGDSQYLKNVRNVATVFNPMTGNYDSTISLTNGIKYTSVTDAQGKVIRFVQA